LLNCPHATSGVSRRKACWQKILVASQGCVNVIAAARIEVVPRIDALLLKLKSARSRRWRLIGVEQRALAEPVAPSGTQELSN
jgi:hypothetical protein